jgi:ATP/maltotriose-dependent transcriptional regulator MalT
LISRTAPQLKLAKLGLKEALVRINTKDLRFNSVEIYQYYQARGYFLQKVIGECENRMEKFQKPHWSYMLTAFKVRLYIDLDDNEKLEQWLMESRLSLYQDIIRTREYELIVLAWVLIARKRYGDAQLLLNRLLNFAEGLKRSHSIVEITNLLAITAMKNSNTGLTEKHFENALAIGIKESGVNFLQGIETELDSIIQFCFYTYIFGPPISA